MGPIWMIAAAPSFCKDPLLDITTGQQVEDENKKEGIGNVFVKQSCIFLPQTTNYRHTLLTQADVYFKSNKQPSILCLEAEKSLERMMELTPSGLAWGVGFMERKTQLERPSVSVREGTWRANALTVDLEIRRGVYCGFHRCDLLQTLLSQYYSHLATVSISLLLSTIVLAGQLSGLGAGGWGFDSSR